MFFMQTLNAKNVYQVSVNSRNFGFIQTWGNNIKVSPCSKQKGNVTPLFWVDLKMPWYYSVCSLLLFLFRTNGKGGQLDENDLRHCYGNFSEGDIFKVTWSQLCLKFLLNNYEAHWKQHFEYPTVEYFTDMDQLMCAKSFIKTSVNMKQKSMKVPGKRSVTQKSMCALRRILHLNRSRYTYFIRFFFSQT